MDGSGDTGMDLLVEAARALDLARAACERPEEGARFTTLADRIRSYLEVSRPTTTLGMPRIPVDDNRLSAERVIHRSAEVHQSHIRVLPN